MKRRVEREQARARDVDDLAGLARARTGESRERPLEGPSPRIGRRVEVMVTGHERHALRGDARLVQDLGERLVLARRADLREVARENEVLRPDPLGGLERPLQLASAAGRARRPGGGPKTPAAPPTPPTP